MSHEQLEPLLKLTPQQTQVDMLQNINMPKFPEPPIQVQVDPGSPVRNKPPGSPLPSRVPSPASRTPPGSSPLRMLSLTRWSRTRVPGHPVPAWDPLVPHSLRTGQKGSSMSTSTDLLFTVIIHNCEFCLRLRLHLFFSLSSPFPIPLLLLFPTLPLHIHFRFQSHFELYNIRFIIHSAVGRWFKCHRMFIYTHYTHDAPLST